MKVLTKHEYAELKRGAEVLKRDWLGDRVLLTPDQKIIKLFRSKYLISSNRVWPYAKRFAQNALKLEKLGIETVHVHGVYKCPSENGHLVIYTKVEGEALRNLASAEQLSADIVSGVAEFIAQLHWRGVYFRSLHFGNILLTKGGSFVLIDVDFMKILHHPLKTRKRVKNFEIIFSYPEDRRIIASVGESRFFGKYLDTSKMSLRQKGIFKKRIEPLMSAYQG